LTEISSDEGESAHAHARYGLLEALLLQHELMCELDVGLTDEPAEQPAPARRSPSPASSRSASPDAAFAAGAGLAGASSDEDEGDEYKDEGAAIKKMKIAKRKKRAEEGGEGDDEAPRP
jgi:hypothetical protein